MNNGHARQLPLDLPHEPATGSADFLVGPGNREAFGFIAGWPRWPVPVALLIGPAGSGKSHLAGVWRRASGAAAVAAARLPAHDPDRLLLPGAVLVEDLHDLGAGEAGLFHLLNLARERAAHVLMTSRLHARALPVAIPDLASRLRLACPVELGAPDDAMLRRLLAKLFADRQLAVDPGIVEFIARRIERSCEAASAIVAAIDREALAGGRAVTRPLAAEVLRRLWPEQSPDQLRFEL